MRNPQLLVCLFAALAVCLAGGTRAEAARYVRVQVTLDGKVLLEGNASDDGHRDADQVWDALKSVTLKPTAEFDKLQISKDAKQALVKNTAGNGEPSNLKIEVAYGGTAIRNELRLQRVPADSNGREWKLDSKDVEESFEWRTISRSEAARLANPKRTK